MTWLVVLGLISFAFIFAGCSLAVKRSRRYREETETRRARAFAQMLEIAEKGKKKNAERTLRSRRGRDSGQGTQNAE